MRKEVNSVKLNRLMITAVVILVLAMFVSGCTFHLEHEWTEATCEEPETCKLGGETRGAPLGHDWQPATCVAPRTCARCGATEGEALGHTWMRATCTYPMTCSVCGAVEGDKAEHTWVEATCLAPRHCSVCGVTEGGLADHKWVAATYNMPRTCAICGITEGSALSPYIADTSTFSYNLFQGASQDYHTITGYDNRIADGTVSVVSYRKYPSDSGHAYAEGYEWREVTVQYAMNLPCRVMWGYTDIYTGPSEYALTDYITYSDGTKEKVLATQTFNTTTVQPSVSASEEATPSPTPTPTPTPTPEPTQAPTPTTAPTSAATSPGVTSEATAASAPLKAPEITPSPTPSPTPIPTPTPIPSEPGKYVSTVVQAVRVPIKYEGLVFYVCNADYEVDHQVDNSFLYMEMK